MEHFNIEKFINNIIISFENKNNNQLLDGLKIIQNKSYINKFNFQNINKNIKKNIKNNKFCFFIIDNDLINKNVINAINYLINSLINIKSFNICYFDYNVFTKKYECSIYFIF